jgi:hypothetical protein
MPPSSVIENWSCFWIDGIREPQLENSMACMKKNAPIAIRERVLE